MKKTILITLLLFTIYNQNAFLCDCKEFSLDSLQKISYQYSDIVFLGELISPSALESPMYKFRIYEVFKGNDSIKIIKGSAFTTCSISPYEKGLWLVYANYFQENIIDIDVCNASKAFSNPIIFPPPPPPHPKDTIKNNSLEYEIKMLKQEIEWEKLRREAQVNMFEELEKLRFLKKESRE